MGIREELDLQLADEHGNSFEMRPAWYTMTKEQKLAFYKFIRAVRFPNGYTSNLARCVSPNGCKLQALKLMIVAFSSKEFYWRASKELWIKKYMKQLLS